MPKKRQLVTSNNCFELGKVGFLRYSNEKHALIEQKWRHLWTIWQQNLSFKNQLNLNPNRFFQKCFIINDLSAVKNLQMCNNLMVKSTKGTN